MIHVKSNHDTSSDTSSEAIRSPMLSPGSSGIASHFRILRMSPRSPRAVIAIVTASARNVDTSASRSESLVRRKPGRSPRCRPHIWLSASRRLAIQPRPAHAAVARPIRPTEVRESIAAFITWTSCWPKSPETAVVIRFSTLSSRSGRLARMKPPIEKPTMVSGNSANTVKYVIPAA
ncbi:hypothetical protein MMON_34340 [Mycolicibacterium monacense]|uniref:Uncharacterized protein n=1 Tax=Mycolicibacterium monacense TaxID=85693 RepID=A0AAD1IX65_MYCMB|nr:hypothetical protein [Mycolicibacterium monacense DSM 44395]BBZ62133.1 hypothetical protein MMON_34340 [Mycolicibacterium monacense]